MNVFVVDDDPAFLERAKRSLAPQGANVFTHLGWRGSLFAARGAKPDVVLLDLNMPGLSGTWLPMSACKNSLLLGLGTEYLKTDREGRRSGWCDIESETEQARSG